MNFSIPERSETPRDFPQSDFINLDIEEDLQGLQGLLDELTHSLEGQHGVSASSKNACL